MIVRTGDHGPPPDGKKHNSDIARIFVRIEKLEEFDQKAK